MRFLALCSALLFSTCCMDVGATCSPTTCMGCCTEAGCESGTSPFACGLKGSACVTCAATQTCQQNACVGPSGTGGQGGGEIGGGSGGGVAAAGGGSGQGGGSAVGGGSGSTTHPECTSYASAYCNCLPNHTADCEATQRGNCETSWRLCSGYPAYIRCITNSSCRFSTCASPCP